MSDDPKNWLDEAKSLGRSLGDNAKDLGRRASEAGKDIIDSDAAKDAAGKATEALSEARRSVEAAGGNIISELSKEIGGALADAKRRVENVGQQVQSSDAVASARAAAAEAAKLIATINAAPDHADDLAALIADMATLLPIAEKQADTKADAVAIGSLSAVGAGIAGVTGVELHWVRTTRALRVSTTSGRTARLAVGARTGAYVACLYGARETLEHAAVRRGADVGVIVASIGLFRASNPIATGAAGGWWVGIDLGVDIGVPILSDLTAFELEEKIVARHELDGVQSRTLERAFTKAEDRSTRRKLATQLAR